MALRRLFFAFILLVVVPSVLAQSVPKFDAKAAFALVEKLASPEMEGRRSGTRGSDSAAEFIAEQFRSYGIDPAGDNGTFLHHYTYPIFDYTGPIKMAVGFTGRLKELTYGRDYVVEMVSGGGNADSDVVFVGYGLSAPGFDEYAGVDVRGKAVIALEGLPARSGRRFRREAGLAPEKAAHAARHGARALLLVPDPAKGKTLTDMRIFGFNKEKLQPSVITMRVESYVAAMLLEHSGKRLDILKKQIDTQLQPLSFDVPGAEVRIEAAVAIGPQRPLINVVGVLPGSDPLLKNEFILVGAHYDMGGIDPDGDMYPGAQDNASGTAIMMQAARALAPFRGQLKRSILFAAWAAEELGYSFGFMHYGTGTPVDMSKVVVNFWVDVAGMGDGSFDVSGATVFPEVYDYVAARVDPVVMSQATPTYYQDYSVPTRGTPILFPHTGTPQPFNHTPWDGPFLVSEQALGTAGQFTLQGVLAMANAPTEIIAKSTAGYAVRSTPVFDFSPLTITGIPQNKLLFAGDMQRDGAAVFFAQLDQNPTNLLDQFIQARSMKDAAGRAVAIIANSDFPRTYGSDALSGLVLTTGASDLAQHAERKQVLRSLGLRALTIRGEQGKLPPSLLTVDGKIKPDVSSVIAGFPLFVERVSAPEIQKLASSDSLLIITDAADANGIRFSPDEQKTLASKDMILAVRFACSIRADDTKQAEAVAGQIANMKENAGIEHLVLSPDFGVSRGATSVASVIRELKAHGWQIADIRKVLGENLQRAWTEFAKAEEE